MSRSALQRICSARQSTSHLALTKQRIRHVKPVHLTAPHGCILGCVFNAGRGRKLTYPDASAAEHAAMIQTCCGCVSFLQGCRNLSFQGGIENNLWRRCRPQLGVSKNHTGNRCRLRSNPEAQREAFHQDTAKSIVTVCEGAQWPPAGRRLVGRYTKQILPCHLLNERIGQALL